MPITQPMKKAGPASGSRVKSCITTSEMKGLSPSVLADPALCVPPLAHFTATETHRQLAMARDYATGCYSLKQIADAFGVHCATVSRATRRAGDESLS